MSFFRTRRYSIKKQYLISLLLIILTSVVCFFFVDLIGYRVVALILLLVVSLQAILFDIFPVLLTALLSALIWNFFFIPPTLTFHTGTPEDSLMLLMYFVVALINAVLTFKIKEFERKARDEEEKEKSIKLYNTLLNSLSHELRTPIATIIGAIDTIKDNRDRLSENNRNELYAEIEIASFRLNRQVENLLSMSRLEAGMLQPKLDWCDLNELVHNIIKNNRSEAGSRSIFFNPDEEQPLFKTDRIFVEQIVQNIIHNALQYTPDNTVIEIGIRSTHHGFMITIADNGNGFPQKEIGFVFDKFYRVNNSKTGGTGLGLSIVKGFAEALGGTILLKNVETGGAKFSIEIPAMTSPIKHLHDE